MPDMISFEEAIKETDSEDRALLIGNGFSANYFNYHNLLAESGIADDTPTGRLFAALGTPDFEAVVRALEDAVIVERAYQNDAHANDLEIHAQKVREALVKAVNKTHPQHRDELVFQYDSSAAFLENFDAVFSLNYDLLLYWVNLEKHLLSDGFGLGSRTGAFHGPFYEEAHCDLFNLHGGLHLFSGGEGEIKKAVDNGKGVIATITDAIANKRQLPVYVAEGTSLQKMRKINSVPYLRHCYDMLQRNTASVFVYGHSADANDAHIYRAIFSSQAKHLYFGIYRPDDEKLRNLDGLLAGYQKTAGSAVNYSFFDSESAHVWGV